LAVHSDLIRMLNAIITTTTVQTTPAVITVADITVTEMNCRTTVFV